MHEQPLEVRYSRCDTREASKLSMHYFPCEYVYFVIIGVRCAQNSLYLKRVESYEFNRKT